MAIYSVVNPTIPKLNELARLAYNIRWYKIEFQKTLGEENHKLMELAEAELDAWIKKNIDFEPKPKNKL